MTIIHHAPIVDEILASARNDLGKDFAAYRNHCYRVLNYCMAFCEVADEIATHKISIAVAFHDLGIWTAKTFDYLEPSKQLVRDYLQRQNLADWTDEIQSMIDQHHKMRAYRENPDWLVEPFRKADWIDVSLGWLKFGLPEELVTEVRSAFPNAGFHRRLVELTWEQFKKEPMNPLPMMKW